MESEQEVCVLMVTLAMQGHINPMFRLAKRLSSKGLHIIFATTEKARQRMPSSKIPITQSPDTTARTPTLHLEFFSDGLSDDFDRDTYVDSFLKSLQTFGSKSLSVLITNLTAKHKKISCIITNPFMPWVPGIAAEHEIPCAVLWIQACAVYSIYYHYIKHSYLFPSLENPNETVELPDMPVLLVKELPSFILPSFILPSSIAFKKLVSDFVQSLNKVKWVMGNSFLELEREITQSMASVSPIIPVGPLVSPFMLGKDETDVAPNLDLFGSEDSCIEWLDKQPLSSVIYISFGSMILLSQNQTDSIAETLKIINRPFLWVVKTPEKGSHKKSGELPSGFLEETKARGLVVKWCHQEKVLMHQSVACFMTHCGWNSTLEAVVAGVPVIAYPQWTDQPMNAKLLVENLKIGVRMRNGEDGTLCPEEVERCIIEVTEGLMATEMKKRAMALKEAAKKAVEFGGFSDQNINHFIKEITRKSC